MEESFDSVSGMYFEKISQDAEFITSVPNGAVVSDGVYFDIPSNIAVTLERDGTVVGFSNKTAVCGQGYYIMRLVANGSMSGVFTFRITAAPGGRVSSKVYKYPKISCCASISSDSKTGLYKYTLPNYKSFYTDVAQYGQSVESAKFVIPRNVGYSFKRNGKDISLVNNKVYKDSGYYTLTVFSYSYANSGGYEATYETVFDFTIPQPEVETPQAVTSVASSLSSLADIPTFSIDDYTASEPDTTAAPESSVIEDSLLESYYESVGIYGESFSTGDAFYTNTANGSIVGGNVYIDMPANMSVEMTKDGVACAFNDKSYINSEGNYILIITDNSDSTVSKASYSFRIQRGMASSKMLSQADTVEGNTSSAVGGDDDSQYADLVNNYDEDRAMYVFDCGGVSFYCSVPDGMFTSKSVMLDIPDSLDVQLYRDGERVGFTYNVS
jgi:hypothetical protein